MGSGRRDWHRWALLLIDAQRDFWTPEHLAAAPDFPTNVSALLAACRRHGIEVVHVRSCFAEDGSNWMPAYRLVGEIPCIEGSRGAETLPFAREEAGEAVFTKTTFDAFLAPGLSDHLHRRGRRILLFAGLETSFCIYFSAASAAQRGFLSILLDDGCADDPALNPKTTSNLLDRLRNRLFWHETWRRVLAEQDAWEERLAKISGGLPAARSTGTGRRRQPVSSEPAPLTAGG